MSEKKTVASLLRSPDTYRDPTLPDGGGRWKEALLADMQPPALVAPGIASAPEKAPLQVHHLWQMAPAGLGLFLGGWLLGSGQTGLQQLQAVPAVGWVLVAAAASCALLAWQRHLLRGR